MGHEVHEKAVAWMVSKTVHEPVSDDARAMPVGDSPHPVKIAIATIAKTIFVRSSIPLCRFGEGSR